jgi:large subunit ribosomal protein L19
MRKSVIIQKVEKKHLRKNIPAFRVGDTLRVHTRIIEGEKERIQIFAGTVIARKGSGLSETFSLHRVAYGTGMERVFPLHSPRIAKIEVTKHGKVRRAKLYYLRGTSGKASKVEGRIGPVTRRREKEEEEEPTEEAMEAQVKPTIIETENAAASTKARAS